MHVGLLEDDVAIQEMLLLVLLDEGYSVTNYQNAEECIEALTTAARDTSASYPPNLLIVDWRLNGPTSGTEVIQRLRALPAYVSLPIILTTAATFNDTQALQNLRVSLLEKPFSVDDMLALTSRLISLATP